MSELLPDGLVPEVTGGTIVLNLADGSQAVIQVAQGARWSLGSALRDTSPDPRQWLDADSPVILGEQWYGVGFLPLARLEGPTGAAFRLIHIPAGSARFRLEGGPE